VSCIDPTSVPVMAMFLKMYSAGCAPSKVDPAGAVGLGFSR
jgi:hypothetical protein